MNISDDTLSAFLDAELPAAEMEKVRQQLREDEQLSNRLAELAAVDQLVSKRYQRIDNRPLPQPVLALLKRDEPEPTKVLLFPLWRRAYRSAQQQLRQHAAMAAAIALAIGLGLGQWIPIGVGNNKPANDSWPAVAQKLESTPSGQTVTMGNGEQLTARLTFVDRQGRYCREFQLLNGDRGSENIACRANSGDNANGSALWQLAASVQLDAVQRPGTYQTASGSSLLDSTLDQMMSGDAFDANAERNLIDSNWKERP